MHVFLLPLGGDRYDLYCEVADGDDADGVEPRGDHGWWGRQRARFSRMLADAEAERAGDSASRPADRPTETSGLARWVVRKIAEAVAELRLLWQLARAPSGILVHADTLDSRRALESARVIFAKDYRKHRRSCGIDAVIAAVTGAVFFFVPGPNLIGWYFAFLSWGHFRAFRGASRALGGLSRQLRVSAGPHKGLSWQVHPSAHLSSLEAALTLAPAERHERILEIERALGLEKLAAFVDRVTRRQK
jgi:hypothetical protein